MIRTFDIDANKLRVCLVGRWDGNGTDTDNRNTTKTTRTNFILSRQQRQRQSSSYHEGDSSYHHRHHHHRDENGDGITVTTAAPTETPLTYARRKIFLLFILFRRRIHFCTHRIDITRLRTDSFLRKTRNRINHQQQTAPSFP